MPLPLEQGDTENEEIFETGFDGARQISYQFVSAPEPVAALFEKQVTHISCGEEHSAAVTSASSASAAMLIAISELTSVFRHATMFRRRGQAVLLG